MTPSQLQSIRQAIQQKFRVKRRPPDDFRLRRDSVDDDDPPGCSPDEHPFIRRLRELGVSKTSDNPRLTFRGRRYPTFAAAAAAHGLDVQDVYREVHPESRKRYRWRGDKRNRTGERKRSAA